MGRGDGLPVAGAAAAAQRLSVTVVYSPHAGTVDESGVSLPVGASVAEAVRACGLLQRHPGLDLDSMVVGVWGALRSPQDLLRDADRVEVYRPLIVDPKEARHRRHRIQRQAVKRVR